MSEMSEGSGETQTAVEEEGRSPAASSPHNAVGSGAGVVLVVFPSCRDQVSGLLFVGTLGNGFWRCTGSLRAAESVRRALI